MAISLSFAAGIGTPHDIVRISPLCVCEQATSPRIACRSGVGLAFGISQPTCWCTLVTFRHLACSTAASLLACLLTYLPVTPSHRLHSKLLLLKRPLKRSTRHQSNSQDAVKISLAISLQPRSIVGFRNAPATTKGIPEDCRFYPVHIARSCHVGHIETQQEGTGA